MTDPNRTLLENSIIEPMPAFRSVDDVIAGERRRQRLLRGVGALAAAVAVVGIVFGIQAGVGNSPASAPTVQPGQSDSGGTPPPSRTLENTEARLTAALRETLSTVVPGATVSLQPAVRNDSFTGYIGFAVEGTVTTSRGVGAVQLVAFWPLEGVPAPSNDELAGVAGCRGPLLVPTPIPNPVGANCEVHATAMGPVALAQQGDGVNHEFTVATSYSDRGHVAMTAWNNPAAGLTTPILSLDQLRRIVTDPAMRP